MKVLYLLRHAKSSWKDPTLEDFDRPLNKRGKAAAKTMGRYLGRNKLRPGLVLCSAARRTQETWELVSAKMDGDIAVEIEDGIYLAGREGLFSRLRKVADDVDSVMLIGHNPGMEWLAVDLTGDGDETAYESMRFKFPTAALAVLNFDVERWHDIEPGGGFLQSFILPRDLE